MNLEEKTISTEHSILDALDICLDKNLVFAIYRLPGQKEISLVIQKDQNLKALNCLENISSEGGFLIAPFSKNSSDKIYLIRPDYIFQKSLSAQQINNLLTVESHVLSETAHISPEETHHTEYIHQINKTLEEIRKGEYGKVVLSRVKIVPGAFYGHLRKIFELLCESYLNAFIYLTRFKDQFWIGASPEPLICSKENELFTVSLAGTRPYSEKNMDFSNWNHKELVEQEYVTRNIISVLEEYDINEYNKTGPYTKKAGELIHLRTDFSFPYNQVGNKLKLLVNALHPTSAICGMPKEKSLGFIKGLEKHNREYYAGYLGPVGIDDRLQLFVNLRCMKVLENELALYIGGGITDESVPEDEWEETEIKADTLLSVVQQIQ
jgi:isochorismate synthase